MTTVYKPSAASFKALVDAINSGVESELETAVERIAKGALAAKRKPNKCRTPARKTIQCPKQ